MTSAKGKLGPDLPRVAVYGPRGTLPVPRANWEPDLPWVAVYGPLAA